MPGVQVTLFGASAVLDAVVSASRSTEMLTAFGRYVLARRPSSRDRDLVGPNAPGSGHAAGMTVDPRLEAGMELRSLHR